MPSGFGLINKSSLINVVHMSSFRQLFGGPRPAQEQNIPTQLDQNGMLTWSPNDPENPKEWKRSVKWYYTFVGILLVSNASMASSTTSGCLNSISEDLHVSVEAAKLSVTLFLLGYTTGPCLWAPLSENFGRRIIFITTFIAYLGFTFLCAFTPNFAGLLLGRFFTGVFISGVLSNTPGVFADLWGPIERADCMTMFSTALFMGPAVGPLTSGFYELTLNWRWAFYQLLWTAGACLPFLFTLPETHPDILLERKAKRIRKAAVSDHELVRAPTEVQQKTLLQSFKIALSRPWLLLLDPICFLLAIYMTVVYMLLYMMFTIIPIVFIEKRGWNSGVGEVPLAAVCVGGLIGAGYGFWDSRRRRRRIAAGNPHRAEDALPPAIVGAIIFPVSMFWLAWTGEYNAVPWIVPCLAVGALSIALNILFIAVLGYLSEAYLKYAASAQATNQIIRSAAAAAAPLFTQQMFSALGVGGGGSLVGGVALLLVPIPLCFYLYGQKIREKSKWTPTQQPTEKQTGTGTQEDSVQESEQEEGGKEQTTRETSTHEGE